MNPRPLHRRDFLRESAVLTGLALLPDPGRWLPRGLEGPLDYHAIGTGLLERCDLDPAAVEPTTYYEVLRRDCLALRLGPFAVHLQRAGFLPKRERPDGAPSAEDGMKVAVPAVLRVLARLQGLTGGEDSWKSSDWRSVERLLEIPDDLDTEQPLTLRALAGENPSRRTAELLDRIEALCDADTMVAGPDRESASTVHLVVSPTRKAMVEYTCMAGVVDPTLAPAFHVPAITGWVHSYYGSIEQEGRAYLVCLEEGAPGGDTSAWDQASSVTDVDLVQHSLAFDAISGLASARNPTVPNWFALGLGYRLVLDEFGAVAARVGAESIADTTPPRSRFVPGGNPNGGRLALNASELRGRLEEDALLDFLERRKQAAYDRLEDRGRDDAQYQAARKDEETVYFNLRNASGNESDGYLHFGPYIGVDVTRIPAAEVGDDLARTQRALFALAAGELVTEDRVEGFGALWRQLGAADAEFLPDFEAAYGEPPSELERRMFAEIDKK